MDADKEQGASGGDLFQFLDSNPLSGCSRYPNKLEVSPTSQPAPPYSVTRPSSEQPSYLGSMYQTPLIVQQPAKYRSFVCPILLSVVVFIFCGFVFGFIAFIIALFGQRAAARGDTSKADKLARVSYGFSIAGLIIAIILIVVLGLVYGSIFMECHNPSCWYGSYTYADSYPPGYLMGSRECRYCCQYYNYNTCENNGYYLDRNGCKNCCYSKGTDCSYGVYYDSNRCANCCEQYSSNICENNGFYLDNKGCKKCCSYKSTDCNYGFYYDSNQCANCCAYFNADHCSQYGWQLDSNGCRTCCEYYDYARLCNVTGLTTTFD